MRSGSHLVLAIALVVASSPLASAQTQIRPRVMVMVDTSGSMTEQMVTANNTACARSSDCTTGACVGFNCTCDSGACYIDTGADGSSSYHDLVLNPARTLAANGDLGLYVGYRNASPLTNMCTNPSTVLSDYQGMTSRMFNAKAALTNVINGSGDIDWGLMRYTGTQCAIQPHTFVPDPNGPNIPTIPSVTVPTLNIPTVLHRCEIDSDCASGHCRSHECSCGSDSDCTAIYGAGFTCSGGGNNKRCRCTNGSTTQCGTGFTCTNQVCQCTSDAQCGDGVCSNGQCTCANNTTDKCAASGAICNLAARQCNCSDGITDVCTPGTCDTTNKVCTCDNTVCAPGVCTAGQCVCNSGTQCGTGGTCTGGKCTCASDANCGSESCDVPSSTCGNYTDRTYQSCTIGSSCGSGTCTSGKCTCATDNDCFTLTRPTRVQFCVGGFCATDPNLCAGNQYGETDARGGTCADRGIPITYVGGCGSSSGAGTAPCQSVEVCQSDSDCLDSGGNPRVGACTALNAGGTVKACTCGQQSDCPFPASNGATQDYDCVGGRCTFDVGCISAGGAILVDPATTASTSSSVLTYVNNAEDLTLSPADLELRAAGLTPLAGAARSATSWYNGVKGATNGAANFDPKLTCRPYVLVQITDGADTCESDDNSEGPVAAASGFVAATVDNARVANKVYVIGLAAGASLQSELNNMAKAGGSGGARFAYSQSDIQEALADIVASSVLTERCNYVDDDCDGNIDVPFFPDIGSVCSNGAVGHCGDKGKFHCSADHSSETCGPTLCRHGAGTSISGTAPNMVLNVAAGTFTVADTGKTVTITAARNSGNMGTFTIGTVSTTTQIPFTDARGLAETDPIGFEIGCSQQLSCRQGSGASIVPGVSPNPATLNGGSGFITGASGDQNLSITIVSSVSGQNLGTFPISAVNSATSLTFNNTNAITDSGGVSWSINCHSPSCRYGTAANLASASGTSIVVTGVSGFINQTAANGGDLGATLTIRSASNNNNLGNWTITAINAAGTQVTINNGSGTNESGAVTWNLYCANAEAPGGCNNFDDDCNGLVDDCIPGQEGSCCNSNGCLTVEVCNGKDDDCNNQIDDSPVDVGGSCGNSVGACLPGTIQCCTADPALGGTCPGHQMGDGLWCVGGNPGYPKSTDSCDGIDDNCDGTINGVPPQPCYDDPTASPDPFPAAKAGVGLCRAGSQNCDAQALPYGNPFCPPGWPSPSPCPNPNPHYGACMNAVGPHPEKCNGQDDDCDGFKDNNPTDSWVGQPCCPTGNDADCTNTNGGKQCQFGSYQCVNGGKQCVGGVVKSPEVCDGADNDCNGAIDDVPGLNSVCTANGVVNQGTCHAVFICVPGSPGTCDGQLCPGGLTCDQQGSISPEICNGLDDDCDGIIDNPSEVAMNDPALMMPCDVPQPPVDHPPCMAGTPACLNGKVVCNGAVTPKPNVCGQMATDCTGMPSENCPSGSMCFQGNCVTPCGDGEFPCLGGFVCDRSQDPPLCVPNACAKMNCPSGQNCQVDMNGVASCVDPCQGVDCGDGFTCSGGACVDNSCRTFGCPDGQVCVGNPPSCVSDPCSTVTCDSSEYCSNGNCFALCPTCMKGESCVDGMCQSDPCGSIKCSAGQVCAVVGGVGSCVTNTCAGSTCGGGQTCCGGACVSDPCALVHCPDGINCEVTDECVGICNAPPAVKKDQIVGAGGGGFGCDVGGSGGGGGWWALMLLGLLWRRRRSTEGVR